MSVLLPTTINGVSFEAHAEYTRDEVAEPYRTGIQVFTDVFNLSVATADADITNGTYHTQMTQSLQDLIELATNGLAIPADPGDFQSPTRNWKMSIQMVSALDQIVRSLKAAGIDVDVTNPSSINISVQDVKNWRNLTYNSNAIKDILTYADEVSGDHNRTLQSLTELIYVKTGNEILSDSLEDLENALSSTKEALDILNEVQQLHNNITAIDKPSFGDFLNQELGVVERWTAVFINGVSQVAITVIGSRLSARAAGGNIATGYLSNGVYVVKNTAYIGDPSLFGFQIGGAADTHFGPLSPQLTTELASNIDPAIVSFLELGERLRLQISELSKTTPTLADGSEDPQSLLGRIRVVYNDMNRVLSASNNDLATAVTRWILDSYSTAASANEVGEPGDLQQNITNAITAGQNLNDQQKEEVRRFLYVFEEYYKSASAILNKLTQIIEKIAQGISR